MFPEPNLPQVLAKEKDSLSLTRMKANRDFDSSKLLKFNHQTAPLTFDQAEEESTKSKLLRRRAVNFSTDIVAQTFDDLWDWRLKQGNLFLRDELKNSFKIFIPSEKHINKPKEKKLKADKSNQYLISETKESELTKQLDQDMLSIENKQVIKEDNNIKDLVKMAEMTDTEILIKYGSENRKPKATNKTHAHNTDLDSFEKASNLTPAQLAALGVPILPQKEKQDSFEVSDDEEEKQRTLEIIKRVTQFLRFKSARAAMKLMVKRKRERDRKKNQISQEVFNDIRHDEDFNSVGGCIVENPNLLWSKKQNKQILKKRKLHRTLSSINEEELLSTKLEFADKLDPLQTASLVNTTEAAQPDPGRPASPDQKQPVKKQSPGSSDLQKKGDSEEKLHHILNKKSKEKLAHEQRIIKHFKANDNNHLKLEAKFGYSIIPQPAFDSTLDVLPVHLTHKKERADVERSSKLLDQQSQMIYTVVSLRQSKAPKKKKPKPADQPVKSSQSLSFTASSQPSSTSNHFSDEDLSDLQSSSASFFDRGPAGGGLRLQSETKQRREAFFREIELFVRRKPYPMRESWRKHQILQQHNSVVPFASRSSGLRRSTTLGGSRLQRRDRSHFNDFIEEFEVLNEKFNEEVITTRKEFKEFSREKELMDYSLLYRSIRQTDHTVGRLEKYNWSGNQMFSDRLFTLSQTEKCINSLNKQETDRVWWSAS